MNVIYKRDKHLQMRELEKCCDETKKEKRKVIFTFIGIFFCILLLMLWLECYNMLIVPIMFIGLFLFLYVIESSNLKQYYECRKNAILCLENIYLEYFHLCENNQIVEWKIDNANTINIKYEENNQILQKDIVITQKEIRTDIDEDTILINNDGVTYLEKYVKNNKQKEV